MAQAGLFSALNVKQSLKDYHIKQGDKRIGLHGVSGEQMQTGEPIAFAANQRDEVRDLHDIAGALGAQPGMKQQTFIAGVVSKGDGTCFLTPDVHTSLSTGGGQAGQGYPCILSAEQGCLTPWDTQQKRIFSPKAVSPTLSGVKGGGWNPTGLLFAAGFSAGAGKSAGSIGYGEDVAPTLKGSASGNCMPSVLCLNGQSGQRMDCAEEQTAALRAQMGVSQPLVCLNDQGGAMMSISEDISGTLRAQEHGHQPLVFDNHGQDVRFKGPVDMAQTVSASFGEGGNNQPLVLATQQGGAEVGVGICPTITAAAGMSGNNQPVLFENHGVDARYKGPFQVSPTLSARAGTGGNNLPLVSDGDPSAICIMGNAIDRRPHNGGNGLGCSEDDVAYTLTASDHHAVFSRQRVDVFKDDEVASTESARQHKDATDLVYQETVGALTSSDRKGTNDLYAGQDTLDMDRPLLIRRLTPLECERLQGFPDGWTAIPDAADSARYKALGNSVAIPCVEYIMRGIVMAVP
nr:DNA cytosine methyltransferase [uncultured Oscillibacter sp.]